MAWFVLVCAGLLEIVWATALKYADGFTKVWPSVIGLSAAALSLFLLSLALKTLPVGTAYAVWVGIGAIGVVVTGAVAFNESIAPLQLLFLTMIGFGVLGLRWVGN